MGFPSRWRICCRSGKRQIFLFNQTRDEFSDLQMVSWGCLSGGLYSLYDQETMMGMVIEEGEAADQGKGSHRKREVHEGDKESLLDTVSQRRETQG